MKNRWVALALCVVLGVSATTLGVEAKVVKFTTADGVEIVADFYPPKAEKPAPTVILLHMYRSSRAAWKPLVPHLHEAGFAILALDLRGHGESVNPRSERLAQRVAERDPGLFNAMHSDVFAAYEFLSKQPQCDLSRLALVGASVGCSVALDYARQDRSVDAVVCLSPGEGYLGVDSLSHMAQIAEKGGRAVLLMAAPGERKACDALQAVYKEATVEITAPGSKDGDKAHGTNLFGQVDGVEKRVTGFLVSYVGEPGEEPVVADVQGDVYYAADSERAENIPAAQKRIFSSRAEARSRGLKAGSTPASAPQRSAADKP